MAWVNFGARNGLRCCLLGLAAIAAALTITSDAADARRHHRVYAHHHHARAEAYDPPFSSIVVDGNSGAVLQASNPDALRHPASLTKVMTLYLLFERLDAGKIKLDTPLAVSQHASDQDPTKLDLKPGQTIAVEDAIKGIVTRSANDAAVVIAEDHRRQRGCVCQADDAKGPRAGHGAHDLYQCVGLAGRRSGHHRARSGLAGTRDPGALPALLQVFFDAGVRISRRNDPRSRPPLRARSTASTASRPDLPAPPASICSPRSIATDVTWSPWSWAALRPPNATPACAS